MKKLIAAILAMAMLFTLAACGASDNAAQTTAAAQETTAAGAETKAAADTTAAAAGEKYVVGVCQLVPHDALDAATQGFVDRLTELLGEDNVEFDVQVAAGDSATCANRHYVSPVCRRCHCRHPHPGHLHHGVWRGHGH